MIKFLIKHPIAVTMIFIAVLVLGTVAITKLPVSLMPNVNIPKITIQINSRDMSARELENSAVKPLRQELMQVGHLDDIHSETCDGSSTIYLTFDYGTNINYAFIEVNEKIDRSMSSLPSGIERPRASKASVTDIPVFYLNMTLKNGTSLGNGVSGDNSFMQLSDFASQVIQKRLEQLSDVAMVDMSGKVSCEFLVVPDVSMMNALGLSFDQLELAIRNNNVNLGNLSIRDGQYQFNVRFSSALRSKTDLENTYIQNKGRLLQLKDVAKVSEQPAPVTGVVNANGKEAVSLAIIKQSDARMGKLKERLHATIDEFKKDYPNIDFEITRDQTELLDYSIFNMEQDLSMGGLLAFLLLFLFLRDYRSPFLIGMTIPASLLVSILLLSLLGITINIISLSGLVLGLGMMVDNSIIVIDNITQRWLRGEKLLDACSKGTAEVFSPLLSSMLTTCAVFIPLIFLSGISGALFYDEAMSVAVGLLSSLIVAMTIIPVYYSIIYRKKSSPISSTFLSRINSLNYEQIYERTMYKFLRHQKMAWVFFFVIIAMAFVFFSMLKKQQLPDTERDDMLVKVDWNQQINVDENDSRMMGLTESLRKNIASYTDYVGEQQFLMGKDMELRPSESLLYIKLKDGVDADAMERQVGYWLRKMYPDALFSFSKAENIFDVMFASNEPPMMARLRPLVESSDQNNRQLNLLLSRMQNKLPDAGIQPVAWQDHIVFSIDPSKLMLYNISNATLYQTLKSCFNQEDVLSLNYRNAATPVIIGSNSRNIGQIVNETLVPNDKGIMIPLSSLISEHWDYDVKTIIAGKEGAYFPVPVNVKDKKADQVKNEIEQITKEDGHFDVSFTGSIFSNRKLIKEMAFIMLVALFLLYFILASQFESVWLPFIILLEVPIDISAALFFLVVFKNSINLMSLIGMVVMCGIIVNDSILKVDTIRLLQKDGYRALRAVLVAGQRRLKPIIMTALATIFALLPGMFGGGLGTDLQRSLSLTIFGGLTIGTAVSLFYIPMLYLYFSKKSNIKPES